MVKIYTDASVSASGAACVAILITGDTYIGMMHKALPSGMSIGRAEVYAVAEALRYYDSLRLDDKCITVYTDRKSLLTLIGKRNTGGYATINKYCQKYSIKFEWVKGHTLYKTPMNLVDTLAKTTRRNRQCSEN